MTTQGPDPLRLLAAAGLPSDIESEDVVARRYALSQAVLELVWSVPAEVVPVLVVDPKDPGS